MVILEQSVSKLHYSWTGLDEIWDLIESVSEGFSTLRLPKRLTVLTDHPSSVTDNCPS